MEARTAYIKPTIPIRCFDWIAWIDGYEEELIGYGETEEQALENLREFINNHFKNG